MKLNKIIQSLEKWAPSIYQESYDNSGLIIGDINSEVSGCLITLDCTEEVVDEAIKKNCNLIISHHPILFKSINKINFNNWESRVIKKSIKNDINIYALHTNLDNVSNGVNKKICEILQIDKAEILRKKENIKMNFLKKYLKQEEELLVTTMNAHSKYTEGVLFCQMMKQNLKLEKKIKKKLSMKLN